MPGFRFILLLGSFVFSLAASAHSGYVAPFYGHITIDERGSDFQVENGMLGIAAGRIGEAGLGFEIFYAAHLNDDVIRVDGEDIAKASITSLGLLAVYRTPGRLFMKLKGGFATTGLRLDFDDLGKIDDDSSGLAYGGAVGYEIGSGALELGYLVLPEFDDFEGLDFDADIELITLGYHWNF